MKQLDERGFPFKLLVVGGNRSEKVVDEIHDMFGNLVDEGKVSFAGMLKGEDLATAYASGDIFLHCSITETFGLVVLESMASGVPVIARDEGGPSEIVADQKSGYLVPPHDLEGFVEKVLKLGNDSEVRKQYALESRRMAEEATWESINHRVACKLADALQTQEPETQKSFSIPIYSWLLVSSEVRSFLGSLIVDFKLMGGILIIFGVWTGLLITWICVRLGLMIKGKAPRPPVKAVATA